MENTESIINFIRGIGLVIHERSLTEVTFLPGIAIEQGALVIDLEKLSYLGDILH